MLSFKKGFTLLELLIVIAIVSLISIIGIGFYANYNESLEIDSTSKIIISDLRQAQSNSMSGLGGFKWGIHFVNGVDDYYELFSTPTDYNNISKVVLSKNYLSNGISFAEPTDGLSKDIIFDKISGSSSDSSIGIISQNNIKNIYVSSVGIISNDVIEIPVVYSLSLTKIGTGNGTITSSPVGINCGSTCSYDFDDGTIVTLTASPSSSTFNGWSGGGCSGNGTCVVNMSSAQSVVASFTLVPSCEGTLYNGYCWRKQITPGQTCTTYCSSIGKTCINSSQTCDQDKLTYIELGISCSSYDYNNGYNINSPGFQLETNSCNPRTSTAWSCGPGAVTTSSCSSSRAYWNIICSCDS